MLVWCRYFNFFSQRPSTPSLLIDLGKLEAGL